MSFIKWPLYIFIILQMSLSIQAQTVAEEKAEVKSEAEKTIGDKLVEAQKKKKGGKDPLTQEVNADKLQKQYASPAIIASTSFDQKEVEAKMGKLESEADERVRQNTLKFFECKNQKDLRSLSECKKNKVKNLSK